MQNLIRIRKKHLSEIYTKHQANNDTGATYRVAKEQVGWCSTTSPVSFLVDGRVEANPQKMAEMQMDTFQNKVKKLLEDLPVTQTDPLDTLRKAMDG